MERKRRNANRPKEMRRTDPITALSRGATTGRTMRVCASVTISNAGKRTKYASASIQRQKDTLRRINRRRNVPATIKRNIGTMAKKMVIMPEQHQVLTGDLYPKKNHMVACRPHVLPLSTPTPRRPGFRAALATAARPLRRTAAVTGRVPAVNHAVNDRLRTPNACFTSMARNSQLSAQAPHSMHLSRSVICTFRSTRTKTACGQTSIHLPQPVHRSAIRTREATFARYFILPPADSLNTATEKLNLRNAHQNQNENCCANI